MTSPPPITATIGVIADDLTGAAEIGAVGLRHGLRAEILVGGQASGEADLVCADTDSRSCDATEAQRRAASAARLLVSSGAGWIYKKVDSVLRGQVTAELEGIIQELGVNLALLVPANPSLGRVIEGQTYFIRGLPLHQTEFARDPEHPRTSPKVLDLLGTPKALPIRVCRVGDPLPDSGIVVGEAGTPDDLKKWAGCRNSGVLPAGGAEFFGALLDAEGRKQEPPALETPGSSAGRELFVCGSSSESCREFVRAARQGGTPVFSLVEALARGTPFGSVAAAEVGEAVMVALRSQRRVILEIGLPPVEAQVFAKRLAVNLVQVVEKVLRRGQVEHVYAEGGATAVELVRRMGWTRLSVVHELAPGVATLAVAQEPTLRLTIKPGSYLWPTHVREPG